MIPCPCRLFQLVAVPCWRFGKTFNPKVVGSIPTRPITGSRSGVNRNLGLLEARASARDRASEDVALVAERGLPAISAPLAIVAQTPVPQPIEPHDREHRDVGTGEASRKRRVADEWTLVEFRPARWLLASLTLLAFWLARPTLGKGALLALAWRFTPRRLRLVAGGVAALALVVLAGSIAALVLVLLA